MSSKWLPEMTMYFKRAWTAVIVTILTAAVSTCAANADPQERSVKLLTANFESRRVTQVEVGDFHFKAGQVAPIHTHAAPAVGYVTKGEITYQVEGEEPQTLREGDAFYEPAGPRILRFDNASATKEAIFLDFNLEQVGEPFIVFEQQPTEAIDRRTLPTVDLGGKSVDQVDVYATELQSGGTMKLNADESTLGLVAEGVIELEITGRETQRSAAGESFFLPMVDSSATIINASEAPTKVITFHLRQAQRSEPLGPS